MLALSFDSLLEQATSIEGQRNLTGNIKSPDALKDQKALEKLEERHGGLFAFAAFNNVVDAGITKYIATAGAEDTGSDVLLLFTTAKTMARPAMAISEILDGADIEESNNVFYDFVTKAMAPKGQMAYPGILFTPTVAASSEPIFIHIANSESLSHVATQCRTLFSLARTEWSRQRPKRDRFPDSFALALARNNIAYTRADAKKLGEYLYSALHLIKKHKGDLASLAGAV